MMKQKKDFLKREQKHLETVFLLLVFLGVTLGFYTPSYKELRVLKLELRGLEQDIDRIELMAGKNRDIREGLRDRQEQLALFYRRIPEQEKQGVKALANTARHNNLEIVSTRIGGKRKSIDKKNKALKFYDKECSFVPVTIQLKGRFQDVVGYLEELGVSPDYCVTVERLTLERRDPAEGLLNILVELKLYVLSSL